MENFNVASVETFWIGPESLERHGPLGLERHCRNPDAHPALREIAGLAHFRKYSLGSLAKLYSEHTGKSITAANVTDTFGRRRPQAETLATYAAIVGMSQRHLQLVRSWPSLEWPDEGFFKADWANRSLGIDKLSPLFETGDALRAFEQWVNDEANRTEVVQLVNAVELETVRVLARDHAGKDPSEAVRSNGVSLEILVKFQSITRHVGARFAFEGDLTRRSRAEELEEGTLLHLFESFSYLTSPRSDYGARAGIEAAGDRWQSDSCLQPADVLAVISVAEQLLAARGFQIGPMRRRLRESFGYVIWASNHRGELDEDRWS